MTLTNPPIELKILLLNEIRLLNTVLSVNILLHGRLVRISWRVFAWHLCHEVRLRDACYHV